MKCTRMCKRECYKDESFTFHKDFICNTSVICKIEILGYEPIYNFKPVINFLKEAFIIELDDLIVDKTIEELDYNTLVEYIFCDITNMQIICKECHNIKSAEERKERKKYNEKRKKRLIEETAGEA